MAVVSLRVPLYIHWSHFLPLLKWTAYVRSGPTIALLGLQCQSVLFILFPDLWWHVYYAVCMFYLLFSCILLIAFSVFYAIKKIFLISVQMTPAFPKLLCHPQAMSSFLFFHQSMLFSDFCKASIFYNLWAYVSIVEHDFFLRHVNSDWIIRMNISDMLWAWEILSISSPGNLWII